MYRFVCSLSVVVCLSFLCVADNLKITPTTTLSALTSNNTSTAGTFAAQSNGNMADANVSKVNVHSLLYHGAKTKIYAHLVLWFGKPGHMDIGYKSTDPAQVKRQIDDMISRGIDGVVMVWYGPHNVIDDAAKAVMHEAEKHHGFTFAIMVDYGAIAWDSCDGCAPQEALTEQMQYLDQTFFSSPAYLRLNGKPAVTNFDIDLHYAIDWDKAGKAISPQPSFLFQNSSGFGHAVSKGAYSWVVPKGTDYGMGYLQGFYDTGRLNPNKQTWGASYKGFDDSLASWGSNRIMGQQCGQTWLQTFAQINSLYDSGHPLPSMQLVTWNDYEEGTEIESGIENCLDVSANVSDGLLQWGVSGNENTVDHYTVYVSNDGQKLMPLVDQPVSIHSFDMCGYSLSAGNYKVFVQAVGKPSLSNHISEALSYTPKCSPSESSGIALKADPSSLTIALGQTASADVVVTAPSGAFDHAVSLSCPNAPAGMSCKFSPSAVTPGSGSVKSVLTISTTDVSAARRPFHRRHTNLFLAVWWLSLPMAGIVLTGERRAANRAKLLTLLVGIVLLLTSCGGGVSDSLGGQDPGTSLTPGTYEISIRGSAGGTVASTTAKVILQ